MARDYLYMFGDVEPFRKIFGSHGIQLDTGKEKECIPSMPEIENKTQESQQLKETVDTTEKDAPLRFDGELRWGGL